VRLRAGRPPLSQGVAIAALTVPHQAKSLPAANLVEPGFCWHSHLIFHFFTEYNAPSHRPSGMLVAYNCPAAFEPATMMKSSVPPNAPVALSPASRGDKGCSVILSMIKRHATCVSQHGCCVAVPISRTSAESRHSRSLRSCYEREQTYASGCVESHRR